MLTLMITASFAPLHLGALLPAAATPAPTPTPAATPSCASTSDVCHWIFQQTGNPWLASGSEYLIVKPVRILVILVLAGLARHLLTRVINRLVRTTSQGTAPAILRPLRERVPSTPHDPNALYPERRRQRAEAIGSVLRSVVTAVIYVVAVLTILGELGVYLAPLIASAGIAGVALGFGAQTLVKDLIAGLFMLLEDQYGVGDIVDLGEASGTVESVGLRVTTIRDGTGVVWYIRNGEIIRVGNRSQGYAIVIVDVPVGYTAVEESVSVLRQAAASLAEDPELKGDLIEPPEVLGVEQLTVDGAVLRATVKTPPKAQWRVGRELRRRLTDALNSAGLSHQVSRVYLQPSSPPENGADAGPSGPT